MPKQYNQFRALLAVTKASLTATFRSPQSIFFSLFFPIVLIWIFGSLGGNGRGSVNVAFEKGTDTTARIYRGMKMTGVLHVVSDPKKDIEEELRRGRITAIISIRTPPGDSVPVVHLRASTASQKDFAMLGAVIKNVIYDLDAFAYPNRATSARVTQSVEDSGRPYRMIDFFLPGMIGFSLIGSAVFMIAFTMYSLKETLVLKRMYATPIRRQFIILGETLGKVIFNMLTVIVLIGFGHLVYGFHLSEGAITFLNMLILSFIALLVFMGFGFFIAAVARTQTVIPIYANLFMFPQYFLSGTFFPRTSLPGFLQPFIQFLPLTAVNDAMRNIAFEGASLFSCWPQVLILLGWGVVIYFCTVRVFRWD